MIPLRGLPAARARLHDGSSAPVGASPERPSRKSPGSFRVGEQPAKKKPRADHPEPVRSARRGSASAALAVASDPQRVGAARQELEANYSATSSKDSRGELATFCRLAEVVGHRQVFPPAPDVADVAAALRAAN